MSKWELYELAKAELQTRVKSGTMTPEEYEKEVIRITSEIYC